MHNQPIISSTGPIHKIMGMTHDYRLLPGTGIGTIIDVTVPSGLGAPAHFHDADEEFFYVLSGELTVELDGAVHQLKAGDSCFLPRGSTHSFTNNAQDDARVLAIVTPGTDAYAFFSEVAEATTEVASTPSCMAQIGFEHGLTFA